MSEENEAVVIKNVLTAPGWFGAKEYDLVLTEKEFLLVKVPNQRGGTRFTRGRLGRDARAGDLLDLEAREGSIVIPHETVQTLRLFAPPVQRNFTYSKIGILLLYNSSNGKRRRLRIAISGFSYQLEREAAEEMPKGISGRTLRRNEFLAEYAMMIKSALLRALPPEVAQKALWAIPELPNRMSRFNQKGIP